MHERTETIEQIVKRVPRPERVEPVAIESAPAQSARFVPTRNKLLELPAPEPLAKRLIFVALALLISALLFYFTSSYWAPAHDGNNQNGYLAGGKLLALHGSTGFEPKSPLSFVGWMWVMADAKSTAPGGGMAYPKYPLGLPALVSLVYRIGGATHGVEWAYRISPVAMTLGVLAMFFLARPLTGSFAAIMAMLLLAGGQVGLILTNNPNSHAPAMFFVMWGMYFLFLWWRRDRWWQAALAGLMLGYAATIRYTEGLMLLPLLCVVLMKLHWSRPRSYLRAAVPLAGWIAPLGLLVVYNLLTLHSLTGYDSTNESTGFSLEHFSDKWNFAVGQLYWTGLYFILPLALAGLVMAFRWNWRVAIVLCAWIVPGSVLYMSYYYGLNMPMIYYLRFFTTLLPPAFLAAAWLLRSASLPDPRGCAEAGAYRSIAGPIAVGAFVALVMVSNMYSLLPSLERDHVLNTNLADVGAHIRASVPAGSVVFGPSQRLLNYLQFAGDYDLYGSDYVENASALPPIRADANAQPTPFQQARRDFLNKAYKPLDRAGMTQAVSKIFSDAIAGHRRAFVILNAGSGATWCKTYLNAGELEGVAVGQWTEPVHMSSDAARTLPALGPLAIAQNSRQAWNIMEIKIKRHESVPATSTTSTAATH